jgi:hypothetical protein
LSFLGISLCKLYTKRQKEVFEEMFDIPRLYISACSNSVQLVPLHPIIVSILFHHYKELKKCISDVEQIEAKVNNKDSRFTVKEEEGKEVDLLVPSSSSSSSQRAQPRLSSRQLMLSDF